MHLVQILLPVYRNDGRPQPASAFAGVHGALTERFGGVTAFTRAPAEGVWHSRNSVTRDDVILVEVMVEALDEAWWRGFRERLEGLFEQESVVVRALPMVRL